MALSVLTTEIIYACNGSLTAFSIPFTFFNNTQVKVQTILLSTKAVADLVVGTDYTISGGDPGTTVNTVATYSSLYSLRISRVTPDTQIYDFLNSTTVNMENIEKMGDRIAMQVQEADADIAKSVRLPEPLLASDFNPILPVSITTAASKTIIVNAAGTGLDFGETTQSISALTPSKAVQTNASGLLESSIVTNTELALLSGTTGVTGTGNLVRSTSPTITSPSITTPTLTTPNVSTATAGRVAQFDASKNLISGTVTDVEIGYLAGTGGTTGTGNLVKANTPALNTPTLTTPIVFGANANTVAQFDGTKTIVSSAVTNTELALLSGATGTTGTGKIVRDTTPTLVTPVLGAATGTSLALGGALGGSALLDVQSTTKGFLEPRMTQTQRDAIATPAAGLQIYNTTSNKLNYYNGVAWSDIGTGTGGGSGINYIVDSDGSAIGVWTTYKDAVQATPVDGTGGSPTVTYAISTDGSLRGASNFLWTHGGSNQQGEGFSYNFSIDPSDKGKVLQCSFEYLIASGTFSDNDMSVWIYDVTNSTLIQPTPYLIKNSSLIEKYAFEFQTSSNSTSYRLIFHVATSTATAYTIRFDNWNLGPQSKLYGSPVTDWTSYTPTGTWTTNTTYTGRWRRIGDSMEINVTIALTGAPNAATVLHVNIPSGYTIDTTKLSQPYATTSLGDWIAVRTGSAYYTGSIGYFSTTQVDLNYYAATGVVNTTGPVTWGNLDSFGFTFTVPITGWNSSLVVSQDASTRICSSTAYLTTASITVTAGVAKEIIFNALDTNADTHGAYSITTGRFTAVVSGWYRFSANTYITMGATAATSIQLHVSKNGTTPNYGIAFFNDLTNSKSYSLFSTDKIFLNAGDYISAWVSCVTQDVTVIHSGSTNHASSFSVERISGPDQIAASETVAAKYITCTSTSLSDSTDYYMDYTTKVFDTHGAVTGNGGGVKTTSNNGAWKFTAPISGIYQVDAVVGLAHAGSITNASIQSVIKKNGTTDSLTQAGPTTNTVGANNQIANNSSIVRLLAGDYIEIVLRKVSGGAVNNINSPTVEVVSVVRVGNY